jgi:hypothetical protein
VVAALGRLPRGDRGLWGRVHLGHAARLPAFADAGPAVARQGRTCWVPAT